MYPELQVHVALTGTSGDVLAGTELANAGSGTYIVWAAADTDAVTISISVPGVTIANADVVAMTDSDATLDTRKIRPYKVIVPTGVVQPTISVGGTVTECNLRILKVS